MTQHLGNRLSRRRLLGGGLAVAATAGLAGTLGACGAPETDDGPSDTGIDAEEGPWSFTDGIGQEIELDTRPTRIAAYGDAAAALMHFGITPVAIFHYIDPADDATFDGLDLGDIPIVGTAYGEIEVERLTAEIRPELIVTTSYPGEDPDSMYGFKDKTQIDLIRERAPIAGILQKGTALDVIGATEELVKALGVDVDGGQVAEDRADFEAAGEELTTAAEKGLSVIPVYADDTGLWYAKAPDDPALAYYQELGVNFTEIEGKDYYWETVSWENADAYSPDLMLYSLRASYTPEQLLDKPVFAGLPVAENDQLHPWKFRAMDYVSQAANMRELAGWLTSDRKLT